MRALDRFSNNAIFALPAYGRVFSLSSIRESKNNLTDWRIVKREPSTPSHRRKPSCAL
jgi:hypothetical protein